MKQYSYIIIRAVKMIEILLFRASTRIIDAKRRKIKKKKKKKEEEKIRRQIFILRFQTSTKAIFQRDSIRTTFVCQGRYDISYFLFARSTNSNKVATRLIKTRSTNTKEGQERVSVASRKLVFLR